MKDLWYGDKRDLIKWATLVSLAQEFNSKHVLQVLYYQTTVWGKVEIDKKQVEIPGSVIQHFRDVRQIQNLSCGVTVETLAEPFDDRFEYLQKILAVIRGRKDRRGIIFLDPDTGLEPTSGRYDHTHVCAKELSEIWKVLNPRDLLVFYQHEDNRRNEEWKNRKRLQFASALADPGVSETDVKIAHAPEIARDVAFYFIQKRTAA